MMYVIIIALAIINSITEITWPINIGGIILALWVGRRSKNDKQNIK